MSNIVFVDDAKVMPKGQITIPKKVRNALSVTNGDRVTFIVNGHDVRVVNSATLKTLFSISFSFMSEVCDHTMRDSEENCSYYQKRVAEQYA